MVQLGIFLWMVFFSVLAFSMMPTYISIVMVISFAGGLLDGYLKNKKKRNRSRI